MNRRPRRQPSRQGGGLTQRIRRRSVAMTAEAWHDDVVLNPRTPRSKAQARGQQVKKGLKWASLVLGTLITVAGVKVIQKELFTGNPEYALKQVTVHTNGLLSRDIVLEACKGRIYEGINLNSIDVRQARRDLEALPSVLKVTFQKHPPDTMSIEIEERQPVAWMECPDKGWASRRLEGLLLDTRGVPFPCLRTDESVLRLPILRTGEITEGVTAGQVCRDEALQAGLDLVLMHRRYFADATDPLELVDLRRNPLITTMFGSRMRVFFKAFDLERQMKDLYTILKDAQKNQLQLLEVGLIPNKNLYVKYGNPSQAALPRLLQAAEVEKDGKTTSPATYLGKKPVVVDDKAAVSPVKAKASAPEKAVAKTVVPVPVPAPKPKPSKSDLKKKTATTPPVSVAKPSPPIIAVPKAPPAPAPPKKITSEEEDIRAILGN